MDSLYSLASTCINYSSKDFSLLRVLLLDVLSAFPLESDIPYYQSLNFLIAYICPLMYISKPSNKIISLIGNVLVVFIHINSAASTTASPSLASLNSMPSTSAILPLSSTFTIKKSSSTSSRSPLTQPIFKGFLPYSDIVRSYLGALTMYLYSILWTWNVSSTIDNALIEDLESVKENLCTSIRVLQTTEPDSGVGLPLGGVKGPYANVIIGAGTASFAFHGDIPPDEPTIVLEQGTYRVYDPPVIQGNPLYIYQMFPFLPMTIRKRIMNYLDSMNSLWKGTTYMEGFTINSYNGPLSNQPQGKVVYGGCCPGGASIHNYMLVSLPSRAFFASLDIPGSSLWGFDNMLARFRRITSPGKTFKSNSVIYTSQFPSSILKGLMNVLKNTLPMADKDATMTLDFDSGDTSMLSPGACLYTYPNYLRCSVGGAFLPLTKVYYAGRIPGNGLLWRRIDHKHIAYITNVQVLTLDIQNGHAQGVFTSLGYFMAHKRVICSAGAFGSARLLQNSGIGDPVLLKNAGITPVIPNPHVGDFYLHYGTYMRFKLRNPFPAKNEPLGHTWGTAYLKMFPEHSTRTVEYVFHIEVKPDMFDKGVEDITQFDVVIFLVSPNARGKLTLTRMNGEPNCCMDFFANEGDRRVIRESMRYLNNVMFPYAETVYPEEPVWEDEKKLDEFLRGSREFEGLIYTGTQVTGHMCGTAAMGRVVDYQCRVKGCDNVFVVDNSVWPKIPDGHTEGAALMIGKMFGDFIRMGSV